MSTRRQRGFTILEALIASILFFLAISIAVMAFMAGSQNFTSSKDSLKACHECTNLLDMIVSEIIEADPKSFTVSSNSITFSKYHNPASAVQVVTWNFSNGKVTRSYVSGNVVTLSENVQNLTFTPAYDAGVPPGVKMVRVNLEVYSSPVLPGGGRRFYKLFKDACPRMDQTVDAVILIN